MTNQVPAQEIEQIVGAKRHESEHIARAVSAEQTVYILHSEQCRASTPDLRMCPYSLALDKGIEHHVPWNWWRHVPDRPVIVGIFEGFLVPSTDPTPLGRHA